METKTDFLTPVIHRIECRAEAIRALDKSFQFAEEAGGRISQAELTSFDTSNDDVLATGAVIRMAQRGIKDKLDADLAQAGFLIAREYIIKPARESEEPVYWVTGNSYFPPLRSIGPVESVYQADIGDDEGHLFATLIEAIEQRCQDERVELDCPPDDNSVYAVDLRRWQGTDVEDGDRDWSLNDEWEAIDGRN